jgi:hypothetical protein
LTREDALILREALLRAAIDGEAEPAGTSPVGPKYVLRFPMTNAGQTAILRSVWVADQTLGRTRLVTVFVEKRSKR